MFLNLLITAIQVNSDGDINWRPGGLADVLGRCWQHCSLLQGAKYYCCKGPWPGAAAPAHMLVWGAVGSALPSTSTAVVFWGEIGSPFFQVPFEWKLTYLVTDSQAGAAQPDIPRPPPCIMEK